MSGRSSSYTTFTKLQKETWAKQYKEYGGSCASFAERHGLPAKSLRRWVAKAKAALAAEETSAEETSPEVEGSPEGRKYARAEAAVLARISKANFGEFASGWHEGEKDHEAQQGYLITPQTVQQQIVRLLELHPGTGLTKKTMAAALIEEQFSRQSDESTHLLRTSFQEKGVGQTTRTVAAAGAMIEEDASSQSDEDHATFTDVDATFTELRRYLVGCTI
jgi:transposase-like protein